MHKIDILMATYNSEKYIEEQLQSIINQTYKNFNINICDDLSTDDTINIISKYKKQYNNISFNINDKNLGIINNFSKLFAYSDAEYIMFSDHDDVWFNNKIEITLDKMKCMEDKYSPQTPILIFTDKIVTDSNLNVISKSHNKSEKFNTNQIILNRLLMGNIASGCTIMVNKALKNICGYINPNAIMHDYWLMLVAAAFGKIGYINKPTMYYRQHKNNSMGASANSIANAFEKFKNGKSNIKNAVLKNIYQAETFLNQYNNILSDNNKHIINEFINLKNKKNLSFINSIIKNKFYKPGLLKNLGLIYAFL